jgi:hypothetical protein
MARRIDTGHRPGKLGAPLRRRLSALSFHLGADFGDHFVHSRWQLELRRGRGRPREVHDVDFLLHLLPII